ncbi:MAG TPA: MotA/TolQ/ExbB proton channel family protein, partial [Fibrobacteraceae bacterium]|nr:MotA/TolQ/ExbB proton channel family protein [Fibrobacteraceae bacterium]
TIFLGEVAHDNGDVQALLKTGALQGKIYDWNTDLIPSLKTEVRTAVLTSKSQNEVFVPLDVLQNKTVKNTVSGEKELTTKEAFIAWFKKGGIVMYPLALAALFAILLCLERFIFLYRRGHLSKRFNKKFDALVEDQKYEEAASLCLKKETSLSLVLFSVVNRAMETRDAAEKSLQEALLREQPKLDKRMGLISAIGTIAPLLGLLGTVTGIITLFTVITELGTNDARVLAGGISEALITTETGLIIAIPVMILHGLLSEKVEQVTSELYIQSTSLLNKLFPEES